MSLSVIHNGFKLLYSDNEDKWSNWDLGLEDKSLAKLKQKVNKYLSDKIKTANLIVGVDDGYSSTGAPSRKQVISRDAKTGKYWVKDLQQDRRELVDANRLFPWTPAIDAKVAEALKIREEGYALLKKGSAIYESIKKTKPDGDAVADMLRELAKAPVDE